MILTKLALQTHGSYIIMVPYISYVSHVMWNLLQKQHIASCKPPPQSVKRRTSIQSVPEGEEDMQWGWVFPDSVRQTVWQFLDRDHSKETLDRALQKVNSVHGRTQETMRKNKDHSVICCTTYTPLSHRIKEIIRKHWDVFNTNPVSSTLFRDPPLFTHSRARNIRDTLVCADTFDFSWVSWEGLDNSKGFSPAAAAHPAHPQVWQQLANLGVLLQKENTSPAAPLL